LNDFVAALAFHRVFSDRNKIFWSRGFMAKQSAYFSISNLIACATLIGVSAAHSDDLNSITAAFDELRSPSALVLTVCHGFGCRLRTQVELQPSDRATMANILRAGAGSPASERRSIAAAVAWFDRRVGPIAGTQHHIARAGIDQMYDSDAQFDCIDTSHNTTALLLSLNELHLLRHHHVEQPVSRGLLVDGRPPHATAVVTELKSEKKWAIDMWTHAAGERPDVMPLERWLENRD
jgi:hypothetical protein